MRPKIEKLFTFFDNLVNLTAEEKEDLPSRVKEVSLKRKELLLYEGQVCHHLTFVLKGCFQMYGVDKSGKDHNVQFAAENDWIGDIGSFYSTKVSKLDIEVWSTCRHCLLKRRTLYSYSDVILSLYVTRGGASSVETTWPSSIIISFKFLYKKYKHC